MDFGAHGQQLVSPHDTSNSGLICATWAPAACGRSAPVPDKTVGKTLAQNAASTFQVGYGNVPPLRTTATISRIAAATSPGASNSMLWPLFRMICLLLVDNRTSIA